MEFVLEKEMRDFLSSHLGCRMRGDEFHHLHLSLLLAFPYSFDPSSPFLPITFVFLVIHFLERERWRDESVRVGERRGLNLVVWGVPNPVDMWGQEGGWREEGQLINFQAHWFCVLADGLTRDGRRFRQNLDDSAVLTGQFGFECSCEQSGEDFGRSKEISRNLISLIMTMNWDLGLTTVCNK